jgi:hypothetical protein
MRMVEVVRDALAAVEASGDTADVALRLAQRVDLEGRDAFDGPRASVRASCAWRGRTSSRTAR